jgi:hypothetical protein
LASCFLGQLHCCTELPNGVSIFAEHRRHQAVESTECLDITLPVQLSEIFGISRINKLNCSPDSTESAEVLRCKGISYCHIIRCCSISTIFAY